MVTLADAAAESAEDARRRDEDAYFPEQNRLQCSLTPAVIRDVCAHLAGNSVFRVLQYPSTMRHISDAAIAVNPPWNVRVASVEADATSAILGNSHKQVKKKCQSKLIAFGLWY